jgi:hypothetical protein
MTISRCLHHAQRIASLPVGEWAAEVKKLPERCEHDDCSTRNCQGVCQDWLRMQFKANRVLADAKRRAGK